MGSHHSYIGTEHLLLGLLQSDGAAQRILQSLGVQVEVVRTTITSVLGHDERIIIQQIIPTSRVKKVIEISFAEAKQMGDAHVGTEHLLLGMLIEGESLGAHVLADLGVTLGIVRKEIESQRLLGDTPSETADLLRAQFTSRLASRRGGAALPFERFSRDAEKAFSLAQLEAVEARGALKTEHLLVGLLLVRDGRAAMVLEKRGVTVNDVRLAVDSLAERGDVLTTPFPSQVVRRVILQASEEAGHAAGAEVDTEHLLLGLLSEAKGIAAHILRERGVTLETVRAELGPTEQPG